MNREIKFRVWDKKDNLMSRPFGLGYRNIVTEDEYYICDDSDLSAEEIEVMEYTGLKDKNGVEIYEGDIVKYESFSNDPESNPYTLADIIYLNGSFVLNETGYTLYEMENEIEVIGNVFENPELLNN